MVRISIYSSRFQVLLFSLFVSLGFLANIIAQDSFPFSFYLDTIPIDKKCQLHSFAYGRLDHQLFLFGGRKDGIHGKESGFGSKEANHELILYHLQTGVNSSIPLNNLEPSISEAISSSATNFCQNGEMLYLIGGYSQTYNDLYRTHPSLIQINLRLLQNLIEDNQLINSAFKQYTSDTFAIAGGQLKFINNHFYLVGGHRFEGAYSQDSRKYKQQYTDCCWVFDIDTSRSGTLQVNFVSKIVDELNFHRRDFNLCPFVTIDDKIEPVAFSGVFMVNDARPFLNISSIQEYGFKDINNFNQRLANYQCAHIGFYTQRENKMNEVFFGGMAEYFLNSKKEILRDPLVPFVKTISRVERDQDGNFVEYALPNEMPGFIGTNSEFLVQSNIPLISKEIVNLDLIASDTTMLGWIFGGIVNHGYKPNPWQDSTVEYTSSNPYLITVHLVQNKPNFNRDFEIKHSLTKVTCYPNPAADILHVEIYPLVEKMYLWVMDENGKTVLSMSIKNANRVPINIQQLPIGMYHAYYNIPGDRTGRFDFAKK